MIGYYYKAKDKYGQGMVEYSFVLGVVVVLALALTNDSISNVFTEVTENVVDAISRVSNM